MKNEQRYNLLSGRPNTHTYTDTNPRTVPTTKILILAQSVKICNRVNKMSKKKNIFVLQTFSVKGLIVNIWGFAGNMLFHN